MLHSSPLRPFLIISQDLLMFILTETDTPAVSLLILLCSERLMALFEGFLPGIAKHTLGHK